MTTSNFARPLVTATLFMTLVLAQVCVIAINSDQQQTISIKSEQKTQQVRKVSGVQSSGTAQPKVLVQQGRIVRNRSSSSTTTTTTTKPTTADDASSANQEATSMMMMIHEDIKRAMNTPPVFVTPTRDFFLDIARHPLGHKLTTMQATDLEGDPIEYSLKSANYRDASPYFSINSSTGELRLANKRIPLERSLTSADDSDDDSNVEDEAELNEKPSSLYFLNVAANDHNYTTVVELQIHVFNTSSWGAATGARTPVQLTIEGGRQGGGGGAESLVQAKSAEYFKQLYTQQPSLESTGSPPTHSNSSLVLPTFVNPALIAPSSAASPVSHNELDDQNFAYTWPVASSMTAGAEQRHAQLAISSHAHPPIDNQMSTPASQQPPIMLSLVIVISACLAVVLVTLVFLIPLSVKRLKKRLKNMEQHVQHEQLSRGASSSACSTSGSSSSTSSSSARHLPCNSLSQFTLASSSTSGPANCHSLILNQVPTTGRRHLPLGRQSSLDSSITQANFSYNSQESYQAQLSMQTQINGLARAKQSAYPIHQNPAYLTEHNANPPLILSGLNGESTLPDNNNNNIYCPIDDEFYSTIGQSDSQILPANCVIVGQTFDSRQYFASECAPGIAQPEVALELKRDTDTPLSTASSSRSSTRSLARFLSLPARHWSRAGQPQPEVGDRKQRGGNLMELEQQLGGATLQHAASRPRQASERNVQTIARVSRISKRDAGDKWELERHKLKFLDILDEGQFGLVWRCRLRNGCKKQQEEEEEEKTVAVKTLKSLAERSEREREELLAEIEIMKLVCGHPNVVRILHCCTRDLGPSRPILLVMEHVEWGKLQWFLEKSRSSHNYATVASATGGMRDYRQCATVTLTQQEEEDDDDDGAATSSSSIYASGQNATTQLSSRELIKFIYHVAKGMEYIASQSIVHRDLASRNVLISSQRVCKIGDFGMARRVGGSSGDVYERHSRHSKIPVRWMAPEVLLNNSFTSQSDVYSFGILMWEIVTLGSTPYRHLKTDQIIEAVARRGERPTRPNYCHALLYNIMSRCWSSTSNSRPTFSQLVGELDQLLNSSDEYIQLDQYPDHNYYNIPQTAAPLELL